MRQKNTVKRTADTVIPVKTSVSRWQLFCLLAAVVVITLISFSPAIDNSFINQDDNIYVFDNADIGKPVPEAIAYFLGPHYFSGNYIPLTMTAYALAWHKAGTQPEFYHTLNIFIHLLNVVLVFGLVYLLSRKKAGVAAIVSLFFGIHPMHVESVAWASELKDVLYTFFFLAGLIAYYKYCERACEKLHPETGINLKPGEQNPFIKNGYGLLLITFVCFVFSVLSKPAAIIFPVVLLLFDFYRVRPSGKIIWLEKLPFFMVSVIFGIIVIKAQQADDLISDQYPLAQRLIFASYALLAYLVKFILPVNLSNFYPYPPLADGHLPYLYYIAPVAVVLLFYGIYRTLKYTRLVAFGFLGMGPVTIAVDSYGPVTDNAQSVYELSLIEKIPNIKQELKTDYNIDVNFQRAKDMLEENDGAGNTFKATAKPVLIGTAVVGATTMIFSIIMALTNGLTENVAKLSLLHAPFVLGLITGGAMIFWFVGASTQAVTTGAYRAVEFIKANIKLEGIEKASVEDSKKVVAICTKYAQMGMLNIFIAVFFAALSFAFVEPFFFIGYLISIAIFGLYEAIFMANAGGAWDNAKKIVEVEFKQKNTPLHDAMVIGDTVGDPFKDTSSVALNPVIKFTTLFGLLAVELAVDLASKNPELTHILALVFFLISFFFVYRSFYGMRIKAGAG